MEDQGSLPDHVLTAAAGAVAARMAHPAKAAREKERKFFPRWYAFR